MSSRTRKASDVAHTLHLRTEREARGWSLTHVTQQTGIAPSDLSLLERGLRPAFPNWQRRIARAFGIPAAKLFAPTERSTECDTNVGQAARELRFSLDRATRGRLRRVALERKTSVAALARSAVLALLARLERKTGRTS
jgi:transcriptional regulator with XRE-family HTH domain